MARKKPDRDVHSGVDRAGRTRLHYAAMEGDVASVQKLLAAGDDPNATDHDGWTSLHFAANERVVEIVNLLIQAGAVVDARDSQGNTPLSNAVFQSRGFGEMIAALRIHGADPFETNNHGISPLSLARTIGNFDVKQFFRDLPEE